MGADAEPRRDPAPPGGSARAEPSTRGLVVVIATGIFVTGLGWPGLIGKLPFTLLFKNALHLPAGAVANFWAVATLAWYFKPVVGLVCDGVPLFGTRRRGYLLSGALVAGVAWLAFAFTPKRYAPFMAVMTALNLAMVVVATVVGGLQVEVAQRENATGRLASLRSALEGTMYIVGGYLAGWLASHAFGWTAATGAMILLSFVPVVLWLYPEARGARLERAVFETARTHLKVIARSRPMWAATGLLFLFYLAPGFQTPIIYYQQDVLKLSPQWMGNLALVGGVGSMLGAAVYAIACRRIALRISLVGGIIINGAGILLYLRYDSLEAAVAIELIYNTLYALGSLPLYDLAARATPKGSESFGFGLVMSVRNVALFAISDPVGSYLYSQHHVGFKSLVWINGGSTLAVLLFLPLIPAALLASTERPTAT
jgi:MFS family permease